MLLLERICALHQSNKESVERTRKNIRKLVELFNEVVILIAPSYENVLRVDVKCREWESEEEELTVKFNQDKDVVNHGEDYPLSLLSTFNKLSVGAITSLTVSELEQILQWFLLCLPSENDEQVDHLLLEVMCVHETKLRGDKCMRRVLREIAVLLRSILDDNSRKADTKELTHRLLMQVERLLV